MKSTSTSSTIPASAARATGVSAHFLPHIQGLRAIAVLLVVIYHFWPGRLTGGYIGVDVFFVISGFLITQQLSRELERTDRIRLPTFWAKRVRRLLPAALLVLLFSAVATLAVMPLSALAENVREILASTFYVENWALAANSVDYLAASNDASLVQHYWSLSLEEQFYLVWPILLLGASAFGVRRFARRRSRGSVGAAGAAGAGTSQGLAAGIAAGGHAVGRDRWNAMITLVALATVASFVLSVVFTQNDPASAYFVTFTRVWEFGIGALLALLPRLRPARVWQSNLLGYAGVIAVIGAAFVYDRNTPFPGWAALLPVLGTAAIIASHRAERRLDAASVLGSRVPRFIGDISYSLYLWHWPLIVIAPYVPGWGLSIYNRIALLAICFVLAWLTKRFVEDPTRRWSFWTLRKPRFTFGFMIAAMAVASLVIGGVSAVQQPKYEAAASELVSTVANPPECFGAAAGPSPVITGALQQVIFGVQSGQAAVTTPGCTNPALADTIIPSPGFGNADRPTHPECLVTLNDSNLFACHFGSTDPAAKRIALVGDSHAYALLGPFMKLADENGWALTTYIKGGCAWNTEAMTGADAFSISCNTWRSNLTAELQDARPYDAVFTASLADETAPGTSVEGRALATGFAAAWKQVTATGTPVITMVDNPSWSDDPNKCLRTSDPADCTKPRADGLVADEPVALAAAASAADGQNVTLLDFTDTFCTADDCLAVIGGANVYRDQDHLTNTFAMTLAPYFKTALDAALNR
ncbi:acyltransferase family protein [Subtercola boreus]|nr:acyltransferase family protein [Subtercola boreus]